MADDVVPYDKPLNERQKRFVTEYLIDRNASQAALRSGYSPHSAQGIGKQLLSFPHVRKAIDDMEDDRIERVRFSADEVLRELQILVNARVTDFEVTEKGELTVKAGVPESALAAVSKIKRRTRSYRPKDGTPYTETEIEISLWDKNAAIEKAMRHLGLLRDSETKVQVNVGTQVWKIGDREITF